MIRTIFKDLGLADYKKAWDIQQEFHNACLKQKMEAEDEREQYLLFCEHPHVYTLGKSGTYGNLLIPDEFLQKINATFYRIDRGGDITYHGPGQIVGYPIFDLEELGFGIRSYIEHMENSIISTLSVFGIKGGRLEGATGVWITGENNGIEKICAIGVKVSRMVSMHGFALNVNTNLDYFRYINPCGYQDKGVTSISRILGKELDMEEVKEVLKTELAKEFGLSFLESGK